MSAASCETDYVGRPVTRFTACELLVQELQTEARPLLFGKDTIDRAIMARLLDAPEQYPQWPLHYLMGCYGRATAEFRSLSTLRDKDAANRLQTNLQYCKELVASNAGLLLTMADNLFPQVQDHSSSAMPDKHRSRTLACYWCCVTLYHVRDIHLVYSQLYCRHAFQFS